jgi:hypothetical protein
MPVERLRSFTIRLTEQEAAEVSQAWISSQAAKPPLERDAFAVWLRRVVLNVCSRKPKAK